MDRVGRLHSRLHSAQPPDLSPERWYIAAAPSPLHEPFHEAWMANESVPYPLRLARAQAAEMAAALPVIKPDELIIGDNALRPIISGSSTHPGYGIRLDRERAEALKRERPEFAAQVDALVDYWQKWLGEHPDCNGLVCHASLGWERVIEPGIDGLAEYVLSCKAQTVASRPETAPWYDGLLAVLEGVTGFIEAHARAAREAADATSDPGRRDELLLIAGNCEHIAHRRPETFLQAVQLFYLLFLVCGHDSPGPIDRFLYPPLQRELEAGTLTLGQAQEIVHCLWLKFEERTAYGATIGGQLPDGSDAANELSHLCLEAISRLRILSPRTAVRWHPGLDPDFMDHACEVVAEGPSYPAFVNDVAILEGCVARGQTLEHARDYTFVGCGQTYPHGRGHGSYEDVIINSAKPIEWALNNGVDRATGEQSGPQTGTPDEFTTYEDFERAFRIQTDTVITRSIEAVNERRRRTAGKAFDFLRSLLTHSCVERGLDWHEGGADYSEGMVDMVGLTTATDSLAAIKVGVFERGIVSLPELAEILAHNWEGHEDLRQQFLKRLPKFGNGEPVADGIAEAEAARVDVHIRSHRTCFGGPWGMDIIGWSGAMEMGAHTGATPDGRRAGESLADCAGPAQGRNVMGLTTTLNSTAKLPHCTAHGPLVLSLRFPSSAVCGEDGRDRLRSVVETYFRSGGQQLQISIASTEDMTAAQANPEAYRDLMVRVGGFSAYFTELEKRWQDDMIARSEALA